jgi:hypothetical protein
MIFRKIFRLAPKLGRYAEAEGGVIAEGKASRNHSLILFLTIENFTISRVAPALADKLRRFALRID